MNYKITEQFSRGEEKLIAEFDSLDDTRTFIRKKLSHNKEQRIELIYRQYDEDVLTQVFNPGNLSIAYAQYAEGNLDIRDSTSFVFNVMHQTKNSLEKTNIANFNHEHDATLFIIGKYEIKNPSDDHDLFFILKDKYILDTLNRVTLSIRNKPLNKSTQSNEGAIFYPHPMQTKLKPPGFPPEHWANEADDE